MVGLATAGAGPGSALAADLTRNAGLPGAAVNAPARDGGKGDHGGKPGPAPRYPHREPSKVGPKPGPPPVGGPPVGPPKDGGAKTGYPRGIPVPCNTDALIAAINLANTNQGGNLDLAPGCTYTLTTDGGTGTGLPAIQRPVTLNCKHTTIARAATATLFNILTVNAGGNLTLNGCTITGGQTSGFGGGIFVDSGGTATINNSTLTNNTSGDGGGGTANFGTITINHTTISRNSVNDDSRGGGIYNTGLLTVSDSRVTYNISDDNGGGIDNDSGTAIVDKSDISHNGSSSSGGGIFADASSTVTLTRSSVTDNTSLSLGGGISTVLAQLTMRHVTVARNTSTSTSTNGGGLSTQTNSQVTVEDSLFKDNVTYGNGAGIANDNSTITVRHTTVVGNRAIGPTSQAAGINNFNDSTITLTATTVAYNTSTLAPGGIFNDIGSTANVDNKSVITGNRPTNCQGSPNTVTPPTACFG